MRHIYLSLIIFSFLFSALQVFSQTKSAKRGIAYGNNSSQDLSALSKSVTWWYNWYHQPESTVINSYSTYGFDYVPMAWNGTFNKTAMRDFLLTHPNVKYILGWNEPNFKAQANMTPTEAAAHWPDIEELADEFNLEIVSPAVNYCDVCVEESGTTYANPIKYLDDFFTACVDCRVDHIAIHSYMGNVSALQWYVGLFKKYNKPIWLTEFANWENNPTLQDQKSFLVGAVDYLENDKDIFRYAWFTGRYTGAPYIGLLENGQSGKLTALGEIYVNMPLHNPEHFENIPSKIEAESYNSMTGILLELTSDVSGFANVGYIDANDWLEYGIDVPEDDTYDISLRIAANQNSSLQFLVDGVILKTISVAATGGWQVWTTIKETALLTAGKHIIRIKANSAGVNFNWFELTNDVVLSNEGDENLSFNVYPNPTDNKLIIESKFGFERVEIINVLGQLKYLGNTKEINVELLPSGTYFLRVSFPNGKSLAKRIIKK
jgi:hypothetical protein